MFIVSFYCLRGYYSVIVYYQGNSAAHQTNITGQDRQGQSHKNKRKKNSMLGVILLDRFCFC